MKIEWSTVFEIMIGTLLSGVILVALSGLFGKFLALHGEKITGVADKSAVANS